MEAMLGLRDQDKAAADDGLPLLQDHPDEPNRSVYGETNLEEIMQIASDLFEGRIKEPSDPSASCEADRASTPGPQTPLTPSSKTLSNNLLSVMTPRQMFEDSQRAATPKPATPAATPISYPDKDCSTVKDFLPSKGFMAAMDHFETSKQILPTGTLSDELIFLYFQNNHPFCPIIHEQTFCMDYFNLSQDEFLQKYPLLLLLAVCLTAYAFADSDQIARGGYGSVHEAQLAFYTTIKKLYHYVRFQTSNEADEMMLAKTALLMSYWHHQTYDTEINSCWADRAFTHTRAFMRLERWRDVGDTLRPKSLYWGCIIRNTLINFGMRRTYRVNIEIDPVINEEELRAELLQEISTPMLFNAIDNSRMVDTYISYCRLSDILGSIMLSRRQSIFENQWQPSDNSQDPGNMEDSFTEEDNNYVLGFLEAGEFEGQLLSLNRDVEQRLQAAKSLSSETYQQATRYVVARPSVPEHYIRCLVQSSIAILFSAYLTTSKQSWVLSCKSMALEKLKRASDNVVSVVSDIMNEVGVEQIPVSILAWTILPTANYLVETRKRTATVVGDNKDKSSKKETPPEAQILVDLARRLTPRYHGAAYMWLLLEQVNRLVNLQDEKKKTPGRPGRRRNTQLRLDPLGGYLTRQEIQANELELLVRATKMLDLNLAYGSPRL